MPWPRGTLSRVSTWPYSALNRSAVLSRAEVYSHRPYQHW